MKLNRKRLGMILVVLGVLLALGVGIMVYYQTEQAAEIARQTPSVEVVIAAADLSERAPVPATGAVVLAKVPAGMVPAEAATRVEAVIGKYPLTRIYRNEVIIQSKLADSAAKTGPAFGLKEGMVAVTLSGSDLLNATGAIRTGDRIDLLLTLPLPELQAQGQAGERPAAQGQNQAAAGLPQVTQTVLQNLEVLQVGNFAAAGQANGGAASGKSLTFQVSHQDALILKWVKDSGGVIDFALRHPSDKEPVSTNAINGSFVLRQFKFTASEPLR